GAALDPICLRASRCRPGRRAGAARRSRARPSGDGHAHPARRRTRPVGRLRQRRVDLDVAADYRPEVVGKYGRPGWLHEWPRAADRLGNVHRGLASGRPENVYLVDVGRPRLAVVEAAEAPAGRADLAGELRQHAGFGHDGEIDPASGDRTAAGDATARRLTDAATIGRDADLGVGAGAVAGGRAVGARGLTDA